MNTYLNFKWTVSRGRETYGYNICTVKDTRRETNHRCNGGGYDMQGTSFALWLMATYPDRLASMNREGFYGIREYQGKIHLDGACGLSSMKRIAEAIGLTLDETYTRNGLQGIHVTDTREA